MTTTSSAPRPPARRRPLVLVAAAALALALSATGCGGSSDDDAADTTAAADAAASDRTTAAPEAPDEDGGATTLPEGVDYQAPETEARSDCTVAGTVSGDVEADLASLTDVRVDLTPAEVGVPLAYYEASNADRSLTVSLYSVGDPSPPKPNVIVGAGADSYTPAISTVIDPASIAAVGSGGEVDLDLQTYDGKALHLTATFTC